MIPPTGPIQGVMGRARPVDADDGGEPHAGIGPVWLIDAPIWHPAWSQYAIVAVHLHDREGVEPAVLQRPGVTHEVLCVTVHPDHPIAADVSSLRPGELHWLTPVNVAEQVTVDRDQDVVELIALLAAGVVHGVLEPEATNGAERIRAAWRNSINATLAHARGEHHA